MAYNAGIFPRFERPRALTVLDARPYAWDEQLALACLQGLVNRTEPRLYLVYDDVFDRKWPEIYKQQYRLRYEEARGLEEVFERFAREIGGVALYDEEMIHGMNVAQTWGAVHGAVAATPRVARSLERFGLKTVEDFRGRFRNRIEAYSWAIDTLLPQCCPTVVANCCTEGWYPTREAKFIPHIKDYLVAVKAFTFDLSSRMRDREEFALFDRILDAVPGPGVLLGWHCHKCRESEYIAQASRHGWVVFCNLRSPNYSVHSGIRTSYPFRQKHADPARITVEDKVYVNFIHSDGDAIWAHNNFYARNWLDSQRGTFPLTWEIQPYAYDLAPGQMEYYYRTRAPGDYFIAGPSGAGYSDPTINAKQDVYFRNSREYMRLTDIRTAFVMNRSMREGYEELDDPTIAGKLVEGMQGGLGFVHGYFGSIFGRHDFVGHLPYIHTALYVGGQHDIYEEVSRFGLLNPKRPLFVAVHFRESADFASLRRVVERLDPGVYKVVNTDEFLLTIQKAHEKGVVKAPADLSVANDALTAAFKKDFQDSWKRHFGRCAWLTGIVDLPEELMLREINVTNNVGYSREQLPDWVAWEAAETILFLSAKAINIKGFHANNVEKAAQRFLEEYADMPDARVVWDAYLVWRNWDTVKNDMPGARTLAKRATVLGAALNARFMAGPA
jgi:hypothetical protein